MSDAQRSPLVPFAEDLDAVRGYCRCGCKEKTAIAGSTNRAKGFTKGQHKPYYFNHGETGPDYAIDDRGHTSPCWIWLRGRRTTGYGSMGNRGNRGKDATPIAAHRFYYEKFVGPVPEGLQLDHLCGVPSCVNPAHLEPVTQTENVRRGRQTKLTLAQAAEIKSLAAEMTGSTHANSQVLGERFGVSRVTVTAILTGRTWKDA